MQCGDAVLVRKFFACSLAHDSPPLPAPKPALNPAAAQLPLTSLGEDLVALAGPPVAARCETDIFTALGLHYVPPHMRGVQW